MLRRIVESSQVVEGSERDPNEIVSTRRNDPADTFSREKKRGKRREKRVEVQARVGAVGVTRLKRPGSLRVEEWRDHNVDPQGRTEEVSLTA